MDEISFETTDILKALDQLDNMGSRCAFSEDGIRNDFLRLHSMAHELINGGTGTCQHRDDETIPDLARDLVDEISDWEDNLSQIQQMLENLIDSTPEEDSEEW